MKELIESKPMAKIGKIKEAADCICLNETTRTSFEIMARNVFRKYKALFPEEQVKAHTKEYNAIEAIYRQLNQNVKAADVSEIIMQLQREVSESIKIIPRASDNEASFIDLSKLDFKKLKAAFAKVERKNTLTYNLQQAIEKKLEQMLKENPLRLDFYERYKEIIDEYNKGKDLENTQRAFEKLSEFIESLGQEEKRAVRESLGDQETLAIYDLLIEGKKLSEKEIKAVKKVASETLSKLKAEKLKVDRWRESRSIKAQVRNLIYENLLWLPSESYSDEEVDLKAVAVYQHVFANYQGGGRSVYQQTG